MDQECHGEGRETDDPTAGWVAECCFQCKVKVCEGSFLNGCGFVPVNNTQKRYLNYSGCNSLI